MTQVRELKHFVQGTPISQPRPRVGRFGVMKHKLKDGSTHPIYAWRLNVRFAIESCIRGCEKVKGPVKVSMIFNMPRPESHYSKSLKKAGQLLPSAPEHHIVKPDIDNLAKAVLDGIGSSEIWGDDNQVIFLEAKKRYTTARAGVWIKIEKYPLTEIGEMRCEIDALTMQIQQLELLIENGGSGTFPDRFGHDVTGM